MIRKKVPIWLVRASSAAKSCAFSPLLREPLPQLLGQPSFPDNVSANPIAWMPRWQNLKNPHEEKFIRGYSIYPDGGCSEFPSYYSRIEGFGPSYKREIKRRYPTPITLTVQAPTLPSETNFVDIDPEAKDTFGIPTARIHFGSGDNELKMFQHVKQVSAEVFRSAGAVVETSAEEPQMPGYSLHETGTCRMGNDPKKFVTNHFGQAHDVPNLYVCDASVFLNCTDKTTTLSILAFSLCTSGVPSGAVSSRQALKAPRSPHNVSLPSEFRAVRDVVRTIVRL
jgi:choline dehydrogenase-like flavoprotein